jgi:neutral ceramidase
MMSAIRGPLCAGAAKADVTPQDLTGLTNLWRTPFEGVHDRIYLRALVVDNGTDSAAIVASDLLEYGDTTDIRERLEKETGIPANHIIITASHAHNTPRVGSVSPGASAQKGGPATLAYTKVIYDQIIAVVQQAKAALQPARVGIGTGQADVNTNRDEYTADGWLFGVNPDGPSDKTVWFVKFETLSGDPIAILINYAVHAVVLGPENTLVTGDLPGAAERYVEHYYDDNVVALWTIGAAGDQNPKYMSWDTTYSQKDREPGYPLMDALGQIVGEEVVRVAGRIDRMTPLARIAAEGRVISCPASPPQRHRGPQPDTPVESLDIYLGLIMINHIAITSVSGEVAMNIYYHLRKDSPFTNTMMITMANDRIGYIVEDAAYDTPTFEAMGTPLQPGTAEKAIVHGLVDMMSQY